MKLTGENYFIFSGGEVHCKLSASTDISRIVCMDYSMNGFMAVCQYREIIERRGMTTFLVYPYFPYSRQDRVMQADEPFSLKIFTKMLNSQKFNMVTTWDPHSDVVGALVDNLKILPQWELASKCIPYELLADESTLFVSPDAGAYKKLSRLMLNDKRIAIGVKNRDSEGKISNTDVFSPVPIEGKDCVIVDDICDGGRTFIELAKTLKTKGAGKIYLYVTHGIFSRGIGELCENIEHIYTTNSFPNQINYDTGYVTVTKII